MIALQVQLLGRFCLRRDRQPTESIEATKAQELFCYLLLHRDRPQTRELLAEVLWSDSPTAQARKNLRQALWQLQTGLEGADATQSEPVVLVDPAWVQINPDAALWIDVTVFEAAYASAQGIAAADLDHDRVAQIQTAVQLYHGDLLEGCYQDWCLYERERFQNMYLALLDKLIDACEIYGQYEAGVDYGLRILRLDRARERTHRQLMRLHYLAGDRTAALRQYERCAAALREELGVQPARRSVALYEALRDDRFPSLTTTAPDPATSAALPEVLSRLRQMQAVLSDFQRQVDQDIRAVELALNSRR